MRQLNIRACEVGEINPVSAIIFVKVTVARQRGGVEGHEETE